MRDFLDNCWWIIRRHFIPSFHGVKIYRALAWKMIFQRIFKGYDESYHWDFYYNISKYIYPRLLDYYDHLDKAPGTPQKYYDRVKAKYRKAGFEYDYGKGRFADTRIERRVQRDAREDWKIDVWLMCEAFRDIIAEEEHWEEWRKCWKHDKEQAQSEYEKLSDNAQRKQFWDSYEFEREWTPHIVFTIYDFSGRKRQRGLKLFYENFQSLWS